MFTFGACTAYQATISLPSFQSGSASKAKLFSVYVHTTPSQLTTLLNTTNYLTCKSPLTCEGVGTRIGLRRRRTRLLRRRHSIKGGWQAQESCVDATALGRVVVSLPSMIWLSTRLLGLAPTMVYIFPVPTPVRTRSGEGSGGASSQRRQVIKLTDTHEHYHIWKHLRAVSDTAKGLIMRFTYNRTGVCISSFSGLIKHLTTIYRAL